MIYQRNKISHIREIYYISCIVIITAGVLICFLTPGGYRELRRMQGEVEARRARVEALKLSNSERVQTVRAMRSDPRTLEKYAREKGYAKKGEIVQQLPEPASPAKR